MGPLWSAANGSPELRVTVMLFTLALLTLLDDVLGVGNYSGGVDSR